MAAIKMKIIKIDCLVFFIPVLASRQDNMDTVPTLEDRLDIIRKCSSEDLFTYMRHLSLESDSRVPSDFLSSSLKDAAEDREEDES
jgi:hypothetical protein